MQEVKFPSIKEVYLGGSMRGRSLHVFEKVDGANVSIRRDGSKLSLWSRGGPIGSESCYYFPAFRKFVFECLPHQLYGLPQNLVLFGEFTYPGFGHIEYHPENMKQLFVIGIYDGEGGRFLLPEQTKEWLTKLGMDSIVQRIPQLGSHHIDSKIASSLLGKSQLYEGPPEGIVIHQYSDHFSLGIRMIKKYHPEFDEIDPSKKDLEKYLTLRRFVKAGRTALVKHGKVELGDLIEETVLDVVDTASVRLQDAYTAVRAKAEEIRSTVIPLFVRAK